MRKGELTLISFPLKSNVLNSPNRGNASKALTLSNSAALGPANFDETDDAAAAGLVSRVVKDGSVVDEAVKVASKIASKGQLAVQAGKEAVNAAYEHTLNEGLRYERRLFHSLRRS